MLSVYETQNDLNYKKALHGWIITSAMLFYYSLLGWISN